jgi:hypothetical protein
MTSLASDNFQLEDLLAFYPPSNTPEIQTIFTSKKEFNELKATPDEPVPKKGEYYKHQKLVQRFMRAVDRLLILHEAGTGKTCTMVSVGEFYEMMSRTLMGMKNSLLRQGFPIKKVYVLVRNDILRDEFINQLVCTCSVDKYETDYVKQARDERGRMFRIKKEIGRFYEVLTFREFSNQISRLIKEGFDERGRNVYSVETILTDEQIRKNYSNCLFFADEIHNLRNVEGDVGKMKDSDKESSIINYASLWKVFHTANNLKIMLATATPMINDPADLVPTLNLLLPKEKQVKDGTDFAQWPLDKFEKLVRGMVSFVRVLDTGIDVEYVGQKVEGGTLIVAGEEVESNFVIEASMMSEFQSQAYIEAERVGDSKEKGLDLKSAEESKIIPKSGGIRKPARHASNFVFPRDLKKQDPFEELGIYGKEGFDKYVEFTNNKYRFKRDFSKFIENEDNFATMSGKFLNIIQLCEQEEGNCFCYTDDFAVASGSVLLGLCFEKYGYSKYDSNAPVFQILGQKNVGGSSYCSKDLDESIERKITVKPSKRYALITSDTDRELTRKILTLFNSRENVNGEYIKVIIASRKAREGLNLANVQNIHLVNPAWNQSNMYQALYRAIRATSHVEIIKLKKKEAIERGEDPENVRVRVKIYQHCSILSSEEEIQELSLEKLGKEDVSVELQMYQWSEMKDRNNSVVFRMLKQCALDCQINKERNQRINEDGSQADEDGSQACNYMNCDYECVDPEPTEIDFTTYDVYYKDELVDKIKVKLQELFDVKNTYTVKEIFSYIQEYPAKFVVQGLAEMIKDKTPFKNRYGYTSFLGENGDLFFLISEMNTYSTENIQTLYENDMNSVSKNEYNENLYGVGKKDFDETTRKLRGPIDENKVKKILERAQVLSSAQGSRAQQGSRGQIANPLLEIQDVNVLITLIEYLYTKQEKFGQSLTDNEKALIRKYENLIYVLQEPLSLLEATKESLSAPTQPKRGRKKILDAPVKITKLKKDINLNEIEYGDQEVIIHTLDLLKVDKADYNTTTKFEKGDTNIRILKSDESGWRDVTDTEKIAYNQLIQYQNKNEKEKFQENEIYGTILQDDKFRIIDKQRKGKKAKKSKKGSQLNGTKCENGFEFWELTNIIFRLGVTPESLGIEIDASKIPEDEETLKAYLKKEKDYKLEGMTLEEMKEAAKWVSNGYTKVSLCQELRKIFEQQELLYKLKN